MGIFWSGIRKVIQINGKKYRKQKNRFQGLLMQGPFLLLIVLHIVVYFISHTTANETAVLLATGLFEDKVAYVSQAKTPVYNGDVLVTKTKGHTAIVVSGNKRNSNIEEKYEMPTIKKGSKGKAVQIWQIIVGANPDGNFGSDTEAKTKTFQKNHGLTVDAIVGQKSWNAGLESV